MQPPHYWWSLVLRGLFGIAFGLFALFLPGVTLMMLIALFGIYALADGLMAIVTGISTAQHRERWWPFIIEGLLGIVAAILAFAWPGITALILVFVIAGWAFMTGIFEIAAAIRMRQVIQHEWLLALSGLLSIAFGLLLAAFPGRGALAVITIIGIYGLIFGGLMLGLGLRIRQRLDRAIISHPPPTTPQPV